MKTIAVKIDQLRPLDCHLLKAVPLVFKYGSGQFGIGNRIVNGGPNQFVVFNEAVIGILGEGDGRKIKGVDNRFFKESRDVSG